MRSDLYMMVSRLTQCCASYLGNVTTEVQMWEDVGRHFSQIDFYSKEISDIFLTSHDHAANALFITIVDIFHGSAQFKLARVHRESYSRHKAVCDERDYDRSTSC